MSRTFFIATLLVCLAAAATSHAQGNAATRNGDVAYPSNLAPGSPYYLAVVTNGTTDATNTLNSYYNSFVQNQAALSTLTSGVQQWQAIVNVTDAGMGLTPGVPIYLVNGTQITPDASTLFSNSVTPIINPLNIDQFGNTVSSNVWTGSNPYDGLQLWPGSDISPPYNDLPTVPMGQTAVVFDSTATGEVEVSPNIGSSSESYLNVHTPVSGWLTLTMPNGYTSTSGYQFDNIQNPALQQDILAQELPVYGISNVLFTPAPEPATITLLGSALSLLAAYRFLKRRRGAFASRVER